MKTSSFWRQLNLIYISLVSLTLLNCNQISDGQQRKKFEFLYKMNNQTSLLREYTNGITYFSDFDFYEGRMKMLYTDINKMETIKDWGKSRVLKEKFQKTIEDNLESLSKLKMKKFSESENIRKEYDVIIMNERVDNFMKELNDEISIVGKE